MHKTLLTVSLLLIFLSGQPCLARHLNTEKFYQDRWCRENGGKITISLPDESRGDCVTEEYVVTLNFGEKWAEAIGQSLYLASQIHKKAGIGLIVDSQQDQTNWLKLNRTIMHYNLPIRTWLVQP